MWSVGGTLGVVSGRIFPGEEEKLRSGDWLLDGKQRVADACDPDARMVWFSVGAETLLCLSI